MVTLLYSHTSTSKDTMEKFSIKMSTTCAAFMLSRWNWHIFPRAETALSYAITLSEWSAFGCLITASNLESASAKEKIYLTKQQHSGAQKVNKKLVLRNHLQQRVWKRIHQTPHKPQPHRQQPEKRHSVSLNENHK